MMSTKFTLSDSPLQSPRKRTSNSIDDNSDNDNNNSNNNDSNDDNKPLVVAKLAPKPDFMINNTMHDDFDNDNIEIRSSYNNNNHNAISSGFRIMKKSLSSKKHVRDDDDAAAASCFDCISTNDETEVEDDDDDDDHPLSPANNNSFRQASLEEALFSSPKNNTNNNNASFSSSSPEESNNNNNNTLLLQGGRHSPSTSNSPTETRINKKNFSSNKYEDPHNSNSSSPRQAFDIDIESTKLKENTHTTSNTTTAAAATSTSSTTTSSSPIDYSSQPRYGFPCRLDPPVAVREEARTTCLLLEHSKQSDAAWRQQVRGISLLAQADESVIETLRKLCKKYGIPNEWRNIAWLTMTKVAVRLEEFSFENNNNPSSHHHEDTGHHHFSSYSESLSKSIPDSIIPQSVRTAIEQDLDRTFTSHEYFQKGADGHTKMRSILYNIWRRYPSISYCQSWNFLCASFLLALGGDEEAALWTMLLYLENLLPLDYYNSNLSGVKIDQRVLQDLVAQHIPKVAAHFDRIGFDLAILIAVWCMSAYTSCLPFETALSIFDWVFSCDCSTPTPCFLAVAVALLKMNQESLLVTADASDAAMLLNQITDITFNWPQLLKVTQELQITSQQVASLRRKYKAVTQQESYLQSQQAKNVQGAGGSSTSSTSSSKNMNSVSGSSSHDNERRLDALRRGGAEARKIIRGVSIKQNDNMFIIKRNESPNNFNNNNNNNNDLSSSYVGEQEFEEESNIVEEVEMSDLKK